MPQIKLEPQANTAIIHHTQFHVASSTHHFFRYVYLTNQCAYWFTSPKSSGGEGIMEPPFESFPKPGSFPTSFCNSCTLQQISHLLMTILDSKRVCSVSILLNRQRVRAFLCIVECMQLWAIGGKGRIRPSPHSIQPFPQTFTKVCHATVFHWHTLAIVNRHLLTIH
jgi:hypothetical protein